MHVYLISSRHTHEGCSRANERERQNLISERDRQLNSFRALESDLQRMRLEESEKRNQLRDKDDLERRITEMRVEITTINAQIKVSRVYLSPSITDTSTLTQTLDAHIIDAQAPITHLEEEHGQRQRELNFKIALSEQQARDLNMSVDKLEGVNKSIERSFIFMCEWSRS